MTQKFTSVTGSVLQRACACGQHASSSGGCEGCKKKREGRLQRAAVDNSPVLEVPSIVHEVLRSPGRPLDAATRKFIEPRFGYDFSNVRVHTDSKAMESAREVNALAYTVGQHMAFGVGQYAPGTRSGQMILAHELAHVMQQRQVDNQQIVQGLHLASPNDALELEAWRVSDAITNSPSQVIRAPERISHEPRVQRVSVGEWFSRFFGGGTFRDEELLTYLRFLDVNDQIEDSFDSDNKAREVVARWKRGDRLYELTVGRKVLLIREMLSGFTGDDDEQAILDVLRGSKDAELKIIVDTIGEQVLKDNFHTDEADQLDQFLESWHAEQRRRDHTEPVSAVSGARPSIHRIVVNQETTQTVTIYWDDGREESDICSTGKGLCCVDSAVSSGPGWSIAESRRSNSNRTPVGRFTVAKKIPKTEAGVKLWTEFVDNRDIALHEYKPVDGTPLSHGCVRLNQPMAQKIYDGSIDDKEAIQRRIPPTMVEVVGLPSPRCDDPHLQREWAVDFKQAGTKPPDGESREAVRERTSIAHTRRTLKKSLDIKNEALAEKIASLKESTSDLPTDIFSSREARARTLAAVAPVADEIPRCESDAQ